MAKQEWLDILNQVKHGDLSAEEAARRLEGQESGTISGETSPNIAPPDDVPVDILGWQKYAWLAPLWIGIGIMMFSAWLMSWGHANERFFWFYCAWLPLFLGLLIMFLGVWSRQARWLHVRVQDPDGPNVRISLPIPTRFAGWVIKYLAPLVPELKKRQLDLDPELFSALGDMQDPLSVEVDEKDGSRVRVYIQ